MSRWARFPSWNSVLYGLDISVLWGLPEVEILGEGEAFFWLESKEQVGRCHFLRTFFSFTKWPGVLDAHLAQLSNVSTVGSHHPQDMKQKQQSAFHLLRWPRDHSCLVDFLYSKFILLCRFPWSLDKSTNAIRGDRNSLHTGEQRRRKCDTEFTVGTQMRSPCCSADTWGNAQGRDCSAGRNVTETWPVFWGQCRKDLTKAEKKISKLGSITSEEWRKGASLPGCGRVWITISYLIALPLSPNRIERRRTNRSSFLLPAVPYVNTPRAPNK